MEQELDNISLEEDDEHLSDQEDAEQEIFEEETKDNVSPSQPGARGITDKEFYKAMQKLKDRGTNAVPPKKSASAYIIFGKEVSN